MKQLEIKIPIPARVINLIKNKVPQQVKFLITFFLIGLSISAFTIYYQNGLGLAYNDARSHLDIGRRVVEGLTPGLAQIGSVWLPLTHFLMVPTIWNDFMWHSGLSGAIQSMIAFVFLGILIYQFIKQLGGGLVARIVGVFIFITNLNILYMQSTAMTELLLLVTMTAGAYYLLLWQKHDRIVDIVKSAFFVMLSSLIRYDGWFLLIFAALIVAWLSFKRKNYIHAEGNFLMFSTLAGFGVVLWLLWNLAIFGDPLYFAFGPFSAYAQQSQLQAAGELATKHNLLLSTKTYLYAMVYNLGLFNVFLATLGGIIFALNKKIPSHIKIASLALLAPLFFNILALYLGHSVLFLEGITGHTWFNVRYGLMLMPAVAIFAGYLVGKLKNFRIMLIGLLLFTAFFSIASQDIVTLDDGLYGSSQKNVTEVSSWLNQHAKNQTGYILISVASHDAIVFSSGLPMKKFIHEGNGIYWSRAIENPEQWARWIVMRTYDMNDLTYREVNDAPGLKKYNLIAHYPFSDIYEIKPEYVSELKTEL